MVRLDKLTKKGFTLIELILVIAIISIIAIIVIPKFSSFKQLGEKRICEANQMTVLRQYEISFLEETHSDEKFQKLLFEYFDQVCPSAGEYSYDKGRVKCEFHMGNDENEQPPNDEVPWL